MKYFFVFLVFVFCLPVSFLFGNPLTPARDSLQPAVLQNSELFINPTNSPMTGSNEGKSKQNPGNPDKKFRIERQGSFIIGHIDEKNSRLLDRRYAVYENQPQKNGEVKPVKVAVLKSMKSPYVQSDLPGNLYRTPFYQIAGKRINEQNTYLHKAAGTGFNLIAGNTFNGLSGTTGRLEYYFSRNLGDMILPGKAGKGLTSVKFYFEGGQKKEPYLLNNISENFTFTRGSFGIGKDYYPLRFMHWGPFAGYGLEYTKWENSDQLISTNFAEVGARLGINILHNLQVIGSATYYHLINSVHMDGNRDVIEQEFDYKNTFSDRPGFGYNVALRLML